MINQLRFVHDPEQRLSLSYISPFALGFMRLLLRLNLVSDEEDIILRMTTLQWFDDYRTDMVNMVNIGEEKTP